jgi:glycosyltransferase involved in cell wall biosynthesis
LNKDSLHELYSVADIGVVPSLHEPFGLVAVEMMMHGLPLIATATSGLNEVVDDTCGLKIPIIENQESVEIDSGLLAEKIKYLFQNPEDRQRMGQNARKRYEEKYSMEMFRKNMLNFYHSLYE